MSKGSFLSLDSEIKNIFESQFTDFVFMMSDIYDGDFRKKSKFFNHNKEPIAIDS